MSASSPHLPLGVQLALGVGYLVASVWWPRVFSGRVDPALRGWLGRKLGVRIGWAVRPGGFNRGPLWFGPLYDSWAWVIEDHAGRTVSREVAVYAAWVVTVPVLAGLLPIALFLAAFLGMKLLSVLVAYPLLFLNIPIYTRYWSGRHPLPGLQLPATRT